MSLICKKAVFVVVVLLAFLLVSGLDASVWAAKNEKVTITLNPRGLQLTVSPDGKVTGTRQVQVRVQKEPRDPNKRKNCNKIKMIDVVGSSDALSTPSLDTFTFGKKTFCYFDRTLTVEPFTQRELAGYCTSQNRGRSQTIKKAGIVGLWKASTVGNIDRTKRYEPSRLATSHPITFQARLNCAAQAGTQPTTQLQRTCNLQGRWKWKEGNSKWYFKHKSTNDRNATYVSGKAGSSMLSLNNDGSVRWTRSGKNKTVCNGRISKDCKKITGKCRASSGNVPFTLTLERRMKDSDFSGQVPRNEGSNIVNKPGQVTPPATRDVKPWSKPPIKR